MNVSFTKNSPQNSTIIDSATEKQLFELSTPATTTTLRDVQSGETVGIVEWHSFHKNRVTVRGEKAELDEWLHSEGWLHSSRTFRASNGIEYKWKRSDNKWVLVDGNSGFTVVQHHPAHLGMVHKAENTNLNVDQSVLAFLDVVVLAFIIMEKMNRGTPPP
ncbi:hypothetical protein PUNSTDRAFT_135351 [Punctularia strigosozonata HHB-11173 SS5]|uniref:uncharacterized protein n=1 Tax=Punctularia strigosozonata (strain HHB-11173) TaxID=741275 RepID=UPI0004417864|nr:uncharacterized protein PUNSTDRAFT_135351 [Punctularia strigosozonata HHB-11173 SS5]EIN07835.1 hypothetical protein PUNSTDRAFT_135351 [Punctularia strigosozonata HHB-11173 SS5]